MVFFSLSATVFWQGSTAAIDTSGSTFLWIALIAGVLGLVFALFLARSVLAYDTGTPEMRLISNAIRETRTGAQARQNVGLCIGPHADYVVARQNEFSGAMQQKIQDKSAGGHNKFD